MQAYRVVDRGFQVGAGALMLLAAGVAAERSHKLEMIKEGKEFTLVKARELQAFKAGEMLGLSAPPKGQLHLVEDVLQGEKGSPETSLCRAVADFHAAVAASERASEAARVAAEKSRAEEQLKAAAAAAEAAWTDEWKTTEAARKEHPKVADYIAARRKESTTQAAS